VKGEWDTMGKRWVPIESNPEVFNRFASILGLDVSKLSFQDVFGLDPVRSLAL
jgi:ubiquitin carboxyl-terminal hydrolase L3